MEEVTRQFIYSGLTFYQLVPILCIIEKDTFITCFTFNNMLITNAIELHTFFRRRSIKFKRTLVTLYAKYSYISTIFCLLILA